MRADRPQPHAGDTVLHCGHFKTATSWHWFKMPKDAIVFKRPDGTTGESHWIAVCSVCVTRLAALAFTRRPTEQLKLSDLKGIVRGDAVWQSDDQIKYKDPS